MALRPCKECGKEISTEATACPHCGAKPDKRTSGFTWVIAIFLGLIIFAWFRMSVDSDTRPVPPAKTAAQLMQEKRDREEGALAYLCKELVKKSLHDPESAQFEPGFYYGHSGGSDVIQIKVRARNAFNAVRLATFECRVKGVNEKRTLAGLEQLP